MVEITSSPSMVFVVCLGYHRRAISLVDRSSKSEMVLQSRLTSAKSTGPPSGKARMEWMTWDRASWPERRVGEPWWEKKCPKSCCCCCCCCFLAMCTMCKMDSKVEAYENIASRHLQQSLGV